MSSVLNTDCKFKPKDIVNGLALADIFDGKGGLLVKKGIMLREVHYQRLREAGLLQNRENDAKCAPNHLKINFSHPDSIHSRLNWLISTFSALQKRIISEPSEELREDLVYVCDKLIKLCDENCYQVLGELYLSDARFFSYIKPLYIAASLNELINRYNQYLPHKKIEPQKRYFLLQAALLHNLGLLISEHRVYSSQKKLTDEQRDQIRKHYPRTSALMAQKIGIDETDILQTIEQHNLDSKQPQLEAQLLRMPFVYAGIAMRERKQHETLDIINPTRKFAQLFSENKLDPVLGGLFLKINGLAPVGSILLFNTREKAVIIAGPDESSIASSTLRLITNNSGVQLGRPGEKFRLDQTPLEQKGISDHHQFAWNKFSPFAAWEK